MCKTLPCMHIYHSECIDKWLMINKVCPICLQRIDRTPDMTDS